MKNQYPKPATNSGNMHGTCSDCDASCGSCKSDSASMCYTCAKANEYVKKANSNDSYGTCTACDTTCASCVGPANTECKSCPKTIGFVLELVSG